MGIKKNCQSADFATCFGAPESAASNHMGERLFDAEMPSMTKPTGIMMLAACAAAFVMAATGIACFVVRMRRSNRALYQSRQTWNECVADLGGGSGTQSLIVL